MLTRAFPLSAFFPFTFHCPVTLEYCTPIALRSNRYSGVSKVSRMKSSIYFVEIHVAPIRTSISDASSSFGCTPSNEVTLMAYSGWFSAKVFATDSFSRTFPLKYSSAVSHSSVTGFWKITPASSFVISSSLLPASCDIYAKSTPAFSLSDTASASLAVSTLVTTSCFLMVRFVNISALPMKFPSSSSLSREHNRQ